MNESSDSPPRLIRVGSPMKRVTLHMQPCQPIEGPVTRGPLIPVGNPVKTITLTMKPVPRTVLLLKCSVTPGVTADTVFDKFRPFLDFLKGLGYSWDRDSATNEPGRITIHLAPTSSQSAERMSLLAEHLSTFLSIIPEVTQSTLTEGPTLKV